MKDVYDLPHHPAAALFPMMTDEELRELAEDIKAHGQQQPITLWGDQVIDGRNRLAACKLAGAEPWTRVLVTYDLDEFIAPLGQIFTPIDYVVSLNLHRRHLTAEQRREVIAALLKATPEKSNRQVAAQVKADHKTVGAVRKEMEGRGEIPHVEKRADTRGRQQPAGKTHPAPSQSSDDVTRRADVARFRSNGFTFRDIANRLRVSVETVKDDDKANKAAEDAKTCLVLQEEYSKLLQDRRELDKVREELDKVRRELTNLKHDHFLDDILPVKGKNVLGRWFRELSKKYHPDRGGSNELMAALVDARDSLLALLPT